MFSLQSVPQRSTEPAAAGPGPAGRGARPWRPAARGRPVAARADKRGGGGPGGGPERPDGRQEGAEHASFLPAWLRSRLSPADAAQLSLLLELLVSVPAARGTAAVLAAYFLHLDPFGNLHWNDHDIVLGLRCALPVMALDAALMLPNYAPQSQKKTIRMKVSKAVASQIAYTGDILDAGAGTGAGASAAAPGGALPPAAVAAPAAAPAAAAAAVAEAPAPAPAAPANGAVGPRGGGGGGEGGDDDGLVEVERTISVRTPQHPLLAALYREQLQRALNNAGRFLSWPAELVLLLGVHLSEEMLYRAVLLTLATGWTIDRLYEAGVDDVVSVAGLALAPPQAGALLAAAGCAALSLALLVQRELCPAVRIVKAVQASAARQAEKRACAERAERLSGGGAGGGATTRERRRAQERADRAIAKLKRSVLEQQRWAVGVEGVRDVTEWACFSASFLLTGNLLAPFASAVAADLAFSFYQRTRLRQLQDAQNGVRQRLDELRDLVLLTKARLTGEGGRRRDGGARGGGAADASSRGSDASSSGEGGGSSGGGGGSSGGGGVERPRQEDPGSGKEEGRE